MLILDVVFIILPFLLFAVSHTVLASLNIKNRISGTLGSKIAFYRLFYNISSLLFFYIFYVITPKPNIVIYDLNYPFDIVMVALQFFSLIGLYWGARGINLSEFIGIAQIKRYFRGEYKSDELDEIYTLRIDGAFRFMRHPIYFFSILFLCLRPTMDLYYITTLVCIIIYFYIGSIYEERKLILLFGERYLEYQKKVPRIIPYKF